MPSIGSDTSLNAKLYKETGKVEYVTQYSVFNDKTGQTTYYDSYQQAADYTNSIGGSAMSNEQLQAQVKNSGGAVTAVYEDGKQVDLTTNKVQNEVLLDQNKAMATGESPAPQSNPPDPQVDSASSASQNSSGEIVASPTPVTPSPANGQVAYDEEGNLLPGYTLTENNDPVYVGNGFVEPSTQALADQARANAVNTGVIQAQNQPAVADLQFAPNTDWRVTLRLAPGATYLYNDPQAGLLQPLKVTNGVVFPYTPAINTAYRANYSPYDLTHSNYRGYFYQNSYTDAVNLTATFTAQSTADAAYVLAVIHFFRSVTKMFYGKDAQRGSPPPLVFLSGLGDYQFNNHPCVVSQFNYVLPPDVDYVSSGTPYNAGLNLQPLQNLYSTTLNAIAPTASRLATAFLPPGAQNSLPSPVSSLLSNPTYVPSKMDITLTLLPVQSRQQVSQQFSLKNFANGQLLKGGFW